MLGLQIAHDKQQFVVLSRCQLQAAQLVRAHLGQPRHHRIDRSAAQRLLGRPQTACWRNGGRGLLRRVHGKRARAQAQQALGLQALGQQGRCKRRMRRADQHHRPTSVLRQGGQQEAPFVVHTGFLQQLGQSAHRPAATGQLGVQQGLTRGHRVQGRAGPCMRPPHLRVEPV